MSEHLFLIAIGADIAEWSPNMEVTSPYQWSEVYSISNNMRSRSFMHILKFWMFYSGKIDYIDRFARFLIAGRIEFISMRLYMFSTSGCF